MSYFSFLNKKKPENETGVFERLQKQFMWRIYNNKPIGLVSFEDLKWFCDYLVSYELDCHICFAGQNGVGKSWTMLSFAMYLNPDFDVENDFIYSFNTTEDLINKLMNYKNKVICIDEANVFLNYRKSAGKKNIALINAIEICRSKKNIVLTAVRDVRKLDLNYRNGKVAILIMLNDRTITKNRPYGMVFMGNWFIENDDKFMLDYLQYINTHSSFRLKAEELPTFRGYFITENHFNKTQINRYLEFKEIQTQKIVNELIESSKTRKPKEKKEERESEDITSY